MLAATSKSREGQFLSSTCIPEGHPKLFSKKKKYIYIYQFFFLFFLNKKKRKSDDNMYRWGYVYKKKDMEAFSSTTRLS